MVSEITVVQPTGLLDSVNGNKLRREIGDLINSQAIHILIDFQNIDFMDSSGLSSLVMILKSVKEVNGSLRLGNLNEQIRMLLQLTAMDSIFQIEPTP